MEILYFKPTEFATAVLGSINRCIIKQCYVNVHAAYIAVKVSRYIISIEIVIAWKWHKIL